MWALVHFSWSHTHSYTTAGSAHWCIFIFFCTAVSRECFRESLVCFSLWNYTFVTTFKRFSCPLKSVPQGWEWSRDLPVMWNHVEWRQAHHWNRFGAEYFSHLDHFSWGNGIIDQQGSSCHSGPWAGPWQWLVDGISKKGSKGRKINCSNISDRVLKANSSQIYLQSPTPHTVSHGIGYRPKAATKNNSSNNLSK